MPKSVLGVELVAGSGTGLWLWNWAPAAAWM